MPGRGPYWKEGGIPDFTIKLEDLTQDLQDQITGGGGAGDLVGSDDVTTPKTDLTATISPTIALGSIQELVIVAWFNVSGTLKVQLSGLSFTDYKDLGQKFDGTSVTTFGATNIDGWTTGLSYASSNGGYIRIQVAGQEFGAKGPNAIINAVSQGATSQHSYGSGEINTTSLNNFTEVKILATNNFQVGSSLRVYKVSRS